jgi:hypothetical protein
LTKYQILIIWQEEESLSLFVEVFTLQPFAIDLVTL